MLAALTVRPECPAAHGITTVVDENNVVVSLDRAAAARLGTTRRRLAAYTLTGTLRPAIALDDSEDTDFGALLYANCITSMGAVLFRRSAVPAAAPFQQELAPADDWDFYLRTSLAGSFAYLPEPVLRWRTHGSNTSRDAVSMRDGCYAVRRRLIEADPRPNVDQLRKIRCQFAYTAIATGVGLLRRQCNFRTDFWPACELFVRAIFARPA